MTSIRTLGLALGLALLTPITTAQLCADPTDNFWKNDTLAQVPGGLTAVSIIPGMCEGEAAAQVFYLPPGSPPQKLNKVSVGFGDQFGAGGFNAVVNVEIYDGITWNGTLPTLGTKVFDLADDTSSSLQIFSHGINEFDMSSLDIVVGDGTDAFVVAFRMDINPNGNCTNGYSANFFTDNGGGGGCSTVPQTSLIDIQGQGWRDAKFATVLGFPLCPIFFNGNWVIRACTEDVGGSGQFVDVGNSLSGFFAPSMTGDGSLLSGGSFSLTMVGQPISRTGYFFFDIVALFAPFKGGVLVPGTSFLIVYPTPPAVFQPTTFPAVMPAGIPSGTNIYCQSWYIDAGGPSGASATNGMQLITP